ncbi:MAG: 4a-hydroxytetrahydrobiopterin dehydratase [Deltaproteobacteria bacterium]|nr:4a-hydroxytetrahydrobiopterin dehydratase [Deltaproteobacteria bacterium]
MSEPTEQAQDLSQKHCRPCEGGVPPLDQQTIDALLKRLPEWRYYKGRIAKTFTFRNHYQTLALVNAIAWISHRENHHPVLEVAYNTCEVRYHTHAIGGLSENDFICAAKVEKLLSAEE